VIFHLAAQIDVRASVDDPVRDARINVLGGLQVLEGARRAGVRKIVFASSGGTIYGEPDPSDLPVTEATPQRPVVPYGVTKRVFTDYLEVYRLLYHLEFTSLALANVYGPRQDPHGEAGVVSIFAGKLLSGEPPMIFGTGEQTRDFVFVDDVVDAMVRAADRGDGLLINIGTGRETSVNQLYASMAAAIGFERPATYAPPRAGEVERSCLDATRAKIQLGWEAWTDIDTGSRAVMEWERGRR
jgi:UDP-glucose 4-epimerase